MKIIVFTFSAILVLLGICLIYMDVTGNIPAFIAKRPALLKLVNQNGIIVGVISLFFGLFFPPNYMQIDDHRKILNNQTLMIERFTSNQERMLDILKETRDSSRRNQERTLDILGASGRNQERTLDILGASGRNQERMLENQERMLENQEKTLGNQEKTLGNQEKTLDVLKDIRDSLGKMGDKLDKMGNALTKFGKEPKL